MKHPVMHFEIMGHDAPKLRNFYADVFGWNVAAPIPESEVQYSLVEPVPGFQRGISGGIGKAPEGYDGHVTFYVVVDDIETAFGKIEASGGSRMMGPDKVPNGPVIGLFRDPEGHTIGLVDPGDDMRNAPLELVPFVFFYGRCEEALEFYKKALGGSYEIAVREGDKVKYATFTGPGISFNASDGMSTRTVDADEGNVSLALHANDGTRAAEIFAALSEGGKVLTAFGDAEWGGKFGALQDRFGTEWFVTAP
ncbi:MAG TPA: VOC family protein [Candidatus Dormibacteraeota bacterium]|nr:VOC family protein [Candidatus Dormibacteraeota bacterium]